MSEQEHMTPHKVNGWCLCMCEECFSGPLTYEEDQDPHAGCTCISGCACKRVNAPLSPAYYSSPPCTECGRKTGHKTDCTAGRRRR